MADRNTLERADLWGAGFVDDPRDSAPVSLLKEQADALTERTKGRVKGVVLKDFDKGSVWASLYVKIPSLHSAMHKLLTVEHSVVADPDNPVPLSVHDTLGSGEPFEFEKLQGMEKFRGWLGKVLSSTQAHAVIANLLSYGTDRAASDGF